MPSITSKAPQWRSVLGDLWWSTRIKITTFVWKLFSSFEARNQWRLRQLAGCQKWLAKLHFIVMGPEKKITLKKLSPFSGQLWGQPFDTSFLCLPFQTGERSRRRKIMYNNDVRREMNFVVKIKFLFNFVYPKPLHFKPLVDCSSKYFSVKSAKKRKLPYSFQSPSKMDLTN